MKEIKPAQRRLGLIPALLASMLGTGAAWAQGPAGSDFVPLVALAQTASGQSANSSAGSEEERITLDRVRRHVPDPALYRPQIEAHIRELEQAGDTKAAEQERRNLERVDVIRRARQVRLSMQDCLETALTHSFAIESASYDPAIATASVVGALAEFDAVFFGRIANSKIDRPSGSQLASASIDQFSSTYGIRKRLSSGMQVSGFYELNRQKIALSFQNINPAYTSTFNLEMRMPLLRGSGIDYNRASIRIENKDREIKNWEFRGQIRDTLSNVDQSYWRLVQARRELAITVRLLGQFESIYKGFEARRYEIVPSELATTKARLERTRAEFINKIAAVNDAQLQLLAILNDPSLPIGGDTEIIPVDFPQLSPLVVDPTAEVQTALDNRWELKAGELEIAKARIEVGKAKNLELPQLDVTFRYSIDGLSNKADRSFDQMSGSNFQSYFVTVEFGVPLGNRAARANSTGRRLAVAKAESELRKRFEGIIFDVLRAARALRTNYLQIGPSLESAESSEEEVATLVARATGKDPDSLDRELRAREAVATQRSTMLKAVIDYNIAIVNLEAKKGTLLRYNNIDVVTSSEPPE